MTDILNPALGLRVKGLDFWANGVREATSSGSRRAMLTKCFGWWRSRNLRGRGGWGFLLRGSWVLLCGVRSKEP